MKASIEVSFAPDGEVLEIVIPKAIQALPLEPRLTIWDEISFMIHGMHHDKAGEVRRIGGREKPEELALLRHSVRKKRNKRKKRE